MTKKTDNIVIKIMSFLSSFIVNHANQNLILNDLFYVTVLELIIQICCYYCFNNVYIVLELLNFTKAQTTKKSKHGLMLYLK